MPPSDIRHRVSDATLSRLSVERRRHLRRQRAAANISCLISHFSLREARRHPSPQTTFAGNSHVGPKIGVPRSVTVLRVKHKISVYRGPPPPIQPKTDGHDRLGKGTINGL